MTYIIAEVGGNHDGKLDQALELIYHAKQTGADAVKFQTYTPETLVHPTATALPQAKGYTKQIDRFRDLAFEDKDWQAIIDYTNEQGLDFLTTVFSVELLERYAPQMKYIKVASGDLTYTRLLRAIAETGKPVILSTGMATMGEIEDYARLINPNLVTVCHCVSIYPTPDDKANLNVIPLLKERFRSVGYSDHTKGMTACLVAAGLGVDVIEKHFTLDSTRVHGDHQLSLEPKEFEVMVSHIRRIEHMMGDTKPAEGEPRKQMRRGAYAKHPIKVGQVITENDIIELRPQCGRKPDRLIGTRARKDFEELECLI